MHALLVLALFGAVLAAPVHSVRWCTKSVAESSKCRNIAALVSNFECVERANSESCIIAIKDGLADAITLDGGDIYKAGLSNYNLHPIIAEDYGTTSETCYYAVAVARRGTGFGLNELRQKKSCHTGLGKSAGWNIPIGTLLGMEQIPWGGTEDEPIESAVANFFSASCAPGAEPGSKLCQLCRGDCSRSHNEPFYGYDGAFQCLAQGVGDVAFVKHLTVPDSEKHNYELLCKDGSRAPIDNFASCHLAKVPAHAVVTRQEPELANRIFETLNSIDPARLFSSEGYGGAKNLLFKDSAKRLVRLPPQTDSYLYLGAEYMSTVRALMPAMTSSASSPIRWCAVGTSETRKCDDWSISIADGEDVVIQCQSAPSVDECLKMIVRQEADAMAVDGGQVFTAGKCGLIPAMVEQYDPANCYPGADPSSNYFAVAVVKRSSGLTWASLKGKRSCHTGVGRTAGWNVPMGVIHKMTNDCNFGNYFVAGCAPGADPSSSFCAQCVGSRSNIDDGTKCRPSSEEQYYGYAGAFRCLVDGAGDVAFIKHTTVGENSGGSGPDWAQGLNPDDYMLVCPNMKMAVPISRFADCNLAKVPAHAVVTRPEIRNRVVNILQSQESKFGFKGTDRSFRMFQSADGKNLLFKDSTKCLQEVRRGTSAEEFLGTGYVNAMTSLRQCSGSTPELEISCNFHSCQQKS